MSNLLGPRDANGIPVPMTVDESIASMKASLLKKIKRSAYVYRVDCGGCNGCEIEIFATLSPLVTMQNASALKSFRHRVMRIFYCLPARSPVQCDPLRCVRGSPRRTRKSVSPTVPAVTAAGSSTISTACGAVRIKIIPGGCLHSGVPANACRHAVRLCDGARPAGAENSRPWPG